MSRKPFETGTSTILLVALLLISATLLWRFNPWRTPGEPGGDAAKNDPTAQPRPIAPPSEPLGEEKNRIEIYNRSKGAVVHVTSSVLTRGRFALDILKIPKGSGTGFVWDEQGRIVTNYNVIKDANQIHVTFDDPKDAHSYVVEQARYDEDKDLAVLWIKAPREKLKPLPLGESGKLQVGQGVLAIGNPFGLDHSLSSGIISALGREVEGGNGRLLKGVIQTDAAINPGNSGGPLLDSAGRLIGVNTAILSPSGSWAGIGFAIPVDVVNRVVPRLIRGEKSVRPGFGIIEAPDQWAKQRGIVGVLVIDLVPDGPAERAGLRPTRRDDFGRVLWGDIIVGVDNHKIRSTNELIGVLEEHYKVGQEVTLHLWRGGEIFDVPLTLVAETR